MSFCATWVLFWFQWSIPPVPTAERSLVSESFLRGRVGTFQLQGDQPPSAVRSRSHVQGIPLSDTKLLRLKLKRVFPIQASSTQYSFHISGNRGYDSNRVLCFQQLWVYIFQFWEKKSCEVNLCSDLRVYLENLYFSWNCELAIARKIIRIVRFFLNFDYIFIYLLFNSGYGFPL